MIELSVSLASNGVVKVPGYEQLVRFGYTKNRGVYRLHVDATGEWEGLTIRAFWHVPDGKDPPSSLVTGGSVDVPASVTAQPGNGCITFEGSDGTKTVTSADLHYRVSANSGTEDGTMPEPGTPAWQQLVDTVHTVATTAEQAKTDAQTAAQQADTSASAASTSAANAGQSAQQAADNLQELKYGIANGDFKGEKGDPGPIGPVGPQGAQGPQGPKGDTGPAVALDPTLSIEGKAADAKATGDAVSELKEDLDSLLADVNALHPLTITAFSVSPSLAEKGSTVSAQSFSYSVNRAGAAVTLEGAEVSGGTASRADVLTEDRLYTLRAVLGNAVQNKTAKISFVAPVYYGVGVEFEISAMTCKLQTSRSMSFTVSAGSGQYILLALPVALGVPTFKVGGFEGGFELVDTRELTNASGHTESYRLYRSTNAGLGSTTVSVT